MLPSLTAAAAARFRARRAERADRNRLRAEIEAMLARHTPDEVADLRARLR